MADIVRTRRPLGKPAVPIKKIPVKTNTTTGANVNIADRGDRASEIKQQRDSFNQAKTLGQTDTQAMTTAGVSGSAYKPTPVTPTPVETPATVVSNALKYPTYTPAPVTNNTAQYNQMFESQKQSAIARIKDAIASGVADQRGIIADAPQRFYDPKNEASFRGRMNEQRIAEQMANMGLAGSGDNISAGVRARAGTQGDINALNQQQTGVITDADRAIARLNQSGEAQIADVSNATDAQRIQAAINEANRVNEIERQNALTGYNVGRDAYTTQYNEGRDALADTRYDTATTKADERLKTQDELAAKEREYLQSERDRLAQDRVKEAYAQSIAGLGSEMDYAQEIMNVQGDGDPTNDWQIPLLQQERQRKVATLDVKEQERIANDYARALDTWDRSGVANQFVADTLGVPLGATTSDQSYRSSQISLEQQRNNIAQQNTNISKQNAETARINATNKKSDSNYAFKDLKTARDFLDKSFTTPVKYGADGEVVVESNVNTDGLRDYLADLKQRNQIDETMFINLANYYNL